MTVIIPPFVIHHAMQDFRNLDVWHKAHALAIDVHRTLARNKRVDAHMRSQLSKAARAIPGCIVEGCGKDSHLELARYADMSIGSSSEVEYWVLLGRDIGYFNDYDYDRITNAVGSARASATSGASHLPKPHLCRPISPLTPLPQKPESSCWG